MYRILKKIFAGEFIVKLFQLAFEFLVVRCLATSFLASWAIYSFVLRLAPYCTFGSISYVNKYYPMRSANNNGLVLLSKACGNVIICSLFFLVIGVIFLFISLFSYFSKDLVWVSLGLISISLVLFYTYLQSVLRNTLNFTIYVKGFVTLSFVQLILILPFLRSLSIANVISAVLFSYLTTIFYYVYYFKKIGLPIFVVSLNFSVIKMGFLPFFLSLAIFFMQSSDRIALIYVGDSAHLELYVACFVFFQLGLVVVNTAGKVFSPYFLKDNSQASSNRSILLFCRYFSLFYSLFFILYLIFGEYAIGYLGEAFYKVKEEILIYLNISFFSSYAQIFFNKMIKASKEWDAIFITLFFSLLNIVLIGYWGIKGSIFVDLCYLSLGVNCIYCFMIMARSSFDKGRIKLFFLLELISYPFVFMLFALNQYSGLI